MRAHGVDLIHRELHGAGRQALLRAADNLQVGRTEVELAALPACRRSGVDGAIEVQCTTLRSAGQGDQAGVGRQAATAARKEVRRQRLGDLRARQHLGPAEHLHGFGQPLGRRVGAGIGERGAGHINAIGTGIGLARHEGRRRGRNDHRKGPRQQRIVRRQQGVGSGWQTRHASEVDRRTGGYRRHTAAAAGNEARGFLGINGCGAAGVRRHDGVGVAGIGGGAVVLQRTGVGQDVVRAARPDGEFIAHQVAATGHADGGAGLQIDTGAVDLDRLLAQRDLLQVTVERIGGIHLVNPVGAVLQLAKRNHGAEIGRHRGQAARPETDRAGGVEGQLAHGRPQGAVLHNVLRRDAHIAQCRQGLHRHRTGGLESHLLPRRIDGKHRVGAGCHQRAVEHQVATGLQIAAGLIGQVRLAGQRDRGGRARRAIHRQAGKGGAGRPVDLQVAGNLHLLRLDGDGATGTGFTPGSRHALGVEVADLHVLRRDGGVAGSFHAGRVELHIAQRQAGGTGQVQAGLQHNRVAAGKRQRVKARRLQLVSPNGCPHRARRRQGAVGLQAASLRRHRGRQDQADVRRSRRARDLPQRKAVTAAHTTVRRHAAVQVSRAAGHLNEGPGVAADRLPQGARRVQNAQRDRTGAIQINHAASTCQQGARLRQQADGAPRKYLALQQAGAAGVGHRNTRDVYLRACAQPERIASASQQGTVAVHGNRYGATMGRDGTQQVHFADRSHRQRRAVVQVQL